MIVSSLLSHSGLLLGALTSHALAFTHHRRLGNISPRQIDGHPWTNPIVQGWYADPDGLKFGDTYWVYATVSIAFEDQKWFEAWSSKDLRTWTKQEPPVFEAATSPWARDWLWAPCTVERNGRYYFFYTANNPIDNEGNAGIGVAVADTPGGPFLDLIDHPIVGKHINGHNAMDQQVFVDDDGTWYLIWGGSGANVARLSDDMTSILPWDDGDEAKDITPNTGFTEGSFMLKRNGIYYFMWSEGGYGTPDYQVAYAMSPSLLGPFNRIGLILSRDDVVADGPGHHSVFQDNDGEYYIVYHRRIIGDEVGDNRVLAVDRFYFNEDGTIEPVVMT